VVGRVPDPFGGGEVRGNGPTPLAALFAQRVAIAIADQHHRTLLGQEVGNGFIDSVRVGADRRGFSPKLVIRIPSSADESPCRPPLIDRFL
jgi:hypothetical protein